MSQRLVAGDFSAWLVRMSDAIRGKGSAEVPCGDCSACCTSSQFVHAGPDEADARAHIPAELLFPAPLQPCGHWLLGYSEQGHCPMLAGGRCSIYAHRPMTCRIYDCRIFAAAGVAVDEDKPLIARQVRRWQFSFRSEAGRNQYDAVRAAAAFLREHPGHLPTEIAPTSATRLAVLALQIYNLFLGRDEATSRTQVVDPKPAAVRARLSLLKPNPRTPNSTRRSAA
jgi:hypothetical protein